MRASKRVREWLVDVGPPAVGLFLAVYLPLTGNLEPWHLPLIGGLVGLPLVGRAPAENASRESASDSGSSPVSTPPSGSTSRSIPENGDA